MTEPQSIYPNFRYKVQYEDGETINKLTYEESMKLFKDARKDNTCCVFFDGQVEE
jgi:hypothetical protein